MAKIPENPNDPRYPAARAINALNRFFSDNRSLQEQINEAKILIRYRHALPHEMEGELSGTLGQDEKLQLAYDMAERQLNPPKARKGGERPAAISNIRRADRDDRSDRGR